MKPASPSSPSHRPGFTLAETAIAVTIIATVMITLIGLIPVGLDQLRQASNTAADARILQAVAGDYQMRTWSEIVEQQTQGGASDFYFDGQGTRVPKGDKDIIFTTRTTVKNMENLPGAQDGNDCLRRIELLVTDKVDSEKAFMTPKLCRTFQTAIAQKDKPLVSVQP